MDYLIIGDIASRYDELRLLLDKMPEGHIVCVGDLFDRHDQPRQVYEFLRAKTEKGEATVIYGNHEDLLLDYFKCMGIYPDSCWHYNGGLSTINAFIPIMDEITKWVSKLPLYQKFTSIQVNNKDVFISHSFVAPHLHEMEACKIVRRPNLSYLDPDFDDSIIWNRQEPIERDYFQIAGHNSQFFYREFKNKNNECFAVCLDDSKNKKLTGMHLKEDGTYQIYQQEYLP
jgi:hypothetical protein